MAYVDDRTWVHPKVIGLSDRAFRLWITSICLSHGLGLHGKISKNHGEILGASPKACEELVTAGLWERNADGNAYVIHDWADYNDDDALERRREQGRERARRWRARNASRGRHGDAVENTSNAEGNARNANVTRTTRARGSESDSEYPLTPAERGLRNASQNSRAAGTNPRAVAERAHAEERDRFIDEAIRASTTWEPVGTDVIHERLDTLEREHGVRLADGERSHIVDTVLDRWANG